MRLADLRSDGQQASEHGGRRFVASHRAGAHFHTVNHAFGAVIGPGDILLPVKDPIRRPMFAQADEQEAQ